MIRFGVNIYIISALWKFGSKYFIKPSVKGNTYTDIKFKDIVGIDEFKEELEDIIYYLRY
jgi:hypothetical protein